MCGICGFVSKKKGMVPEKELIRDMLMRLYHRGPDGRGWFRDQTICLGHTRLSIIDLESGTQPLCNENESLWISFNGEIYNYIELREELTALGHIFRTHSDTEVIVHAWESWREDCFSRFNGQWAIAIWDRNRKELILSRDRHGIRPLYYTESAEKFLFASEIKALFADKSLKRGFSHRGLNQTFVLWGPMAPQTVFEGVYELEPGHYALYRDNILVKRPYWKINFPNDFNHEYKERELVDRAYELKERFIEASRLRFERSDVPVGSYLSGGIDSSICASIVNSYAKGGLNTFSIRFSHKQFDEGRYQRIMSETLGTRHKSFTVNPEDICAVFPNVISHTERPILRTAPAPLYLLSKLVRESGYKVVVTGEGADEVLGGYDIFREAYVRTKIAREGQTDENNKLLSKLYPWMGDAFGKTPAFSQSFFGKNLNLNDPALSHRPRWDNGRLLLPMLSAEYGQAFRNDDVAGYILNNLDDFSSNWSYLAKAQWFEYKTFLSSYILSAQGDRMLMANSIEGRFPFLDVNVNEFADSLNPELKLRTRDLTEKLILKEAFKEEIPDEIIKRPKQPYQSPNSLSFLEYGNISSWIEEVANREILEESGVFNPLAVEKLKEKLRRTSGEGFRHGDNTRLVAIYSTMLIYDQFISKNVFTEDVPSVWTEEEFTADFLDA